MSASQEIIFINYVIPAIGHDNREIAVTLWRNHRSRSREIRTCLADDSCVPLC